LSYDDSVALVLLQLIRILDLPGTNAAIGQVGGASAGAAEGRPRSGPAYIEVGDLALNDRLRVIKSL
jgi:hypothetical protein